MSNTIVQTKIPMLFFLVIFVAAMLLFSVLFYQQRKKETGNLRNACVSILCLICAVYWFFAYLLPSVRISLGHPLPSASLSVSPIAIHLLTLLAVVCSVVLCFVVAFQLHKKVGSNAKIVYRTSSIIAIVFGVAVFVMYLLPLLRFLFP